MYKIFLSVRNRLAITTKCITSIRKYSELPHQIYVFDNSTNYKIQEHFMYFSLLYERGFITQYTVNSNESTFNAFSKAVSCNQFGLHHEQDPDKDKFDFLLILDNDIIIVQQGWDRILKNAWDDVNKHHMNHIKVIGQLPGGISSRKDCLVKIAGFNAQIGIHGGSGFWSVRPNFFRDVGYLDLKPLVGHDKKHDQNYWKKMEQVNNKKEYILGLDTKLVIHTGGLAGSICNTLTKNRSPYLKKPVNDLIKFEESDKEIDSLTFNDFYNKIINNNDMINNW